MGYLGYLNQYSSSLKCLQYVNILLQISYLGRYIDWLLEDSFQKAEMVLCLGVKS